MKMERLTCAALAGSLCLMMPVASLAQLPPAATLLPPGFTLETERSFGPATMISAVKANEKVPKPHQDNKIRLSIGSNGMPGAEERVEMMADGPEDPARKVPGSVTRDEPCGKQRYRGGLLTCRKSITPWVGSGNAPDLIMLTVNWVVATPTGLVNIGVSNFVGAKATAVGWIDDIADKIIPNDKKD